MALIFPTNRCNLRCTHCMREEYGGKSLDTELLERFLGDLKKLGGNNRHSITGGEPTMHPDLHALFGTFRKYGMTAGMVTNAQSEEGIDKTIMNRDVVTAVNISLEGPDANINDSVRGDGSFQKVHRAIQRYVKSGIEVRLHTVLHDENVDSVKDMFKFANELKVKKLNFSTLHPIQKASNNELSVSQWKLENARIVRRSEAKKYPHIDSGITIRHMVPYIEPTWKEQWCQPLRGKLENGIALMPDGKVSLCCDLVNIDFQHNRYQGENSRLNHILGDYTVDSLETILDNKRKLIYELKRRREFDAKHGKLIGPRQFICENCKFYFNH